MSNRFRLLVTSAAAAAVTIAGCARDVRPKPTAPTTKPVETSLKIKSSPVVQPAVGLQQRMGDEIVVAGHLYRIGTPVVTWMDPGGYDAYRTAKHFGPVEQAGFVESYRSFTERAATRPQTVRDGGRTDPGMTNPDRYGTRYARETTRATSRAATMPGGIDAYVAANFADPTTRPLTPEEVESIRNGGWTLPELQDKVDQFVLHYDVAGISSQCFKTLHDLRGLSVHFMLDIDGTIYQTLDLKEATWHATKSNSRSIGIEIANVGSYSMSEGPQTLNQWYKKDESGKTYIAVPERLGGQNATRVPGIYRPIRNELITGEIRGVKQRMYDLTPQQYAALVKLTAALGDVFPKIKLDYPRGPDGKVVTRTLTDAEYDNYHGVMGHFHVQRDKSDPGVAFQWDYLIDNAKKLLNERHATASK